jgi:hypothetical protein
MDEQLRVIEAYILARKGVKVVINAPDTPERFHLFNHAYFYAKTWADAVQDPQAPQGR